MYASNFVARRILRGSGMMETHIGSQELPVHTPSQLHIQCLLTELMTVIGNAMVGVFLPWKLASATD